MTTAILSAEDLVKRYRVPGRRDPLIAVDGVSLSISPGEIVGVVGESGSGKSTVSRMLVGIEPATSGTVRHGDAAVHSTAQWRALREDVQYVFQDPYGSLAPHLTVRQTVGDALDLRRRGTAGERNERVATALERVGLRAEDGRSYPGVFSGGQRQRISLARALVMEPRLIICDEIVSGLDVSVQAQILNLLLELRERLDVAYVFVSHDLRVVKYLSDRVLVMHDGHIVEQGEAAAVFEDPQHEYTKTLLASLPAFTPGHFVPRVAS
ncbi:MAG: ATP-binding cassette domain-containing protein [Microbacterium sp.]